MAAVQVAAHILLAVATAAAGTAAAGVTPAQGLRACPGASGTALYATCNSRTQLRELMQARLNRLNYNAKARCGHCLYPPSARDHLNWMKALMESKHLVFHLMQVLGVKMARRYFCTSNVRDLLRIHDPHIGTPRNYVLKRLEGASAKQVYVVHNGLEQLRGKRMTIADIVAERQREDGHAHWNYAVEELVYSMANPTRFANDVKMHVFGGNVAFTLFLPKRSHTGPDTHACQVCLHCRHMPRGCTRRLHGGSNLTTEAYDMYLLKRGQRMRCPVPGHGKVMLALSSVLGKAFGLFMRVDWYEAHPLPILSELTVVPGWDPHDPTQKELLWYQRGEMSHKLGQLWRGLEGGGGSGQVPCWLPPDWRRSVLTCRGFGGRSLEQLMAANCLPEKHQPAGGHAAKGQGTAELRRRLQHEVAMWRQVKAAIGAIYANASAAGARSAVPAALPPAKTQCVDAR